ncbi:dynein regulatory complex protein 8 isoform X3 [Phoca vitulina]|uniref:dynein regulatory complex protein 8 isoform X3 n=1 Tax=Phoca vitulina TaxID=9720 RepID=UPI001395ECFC|nr:dynein regulatory complex protein 8 isoform X3 [Phoca vitulina]
MLPRLLANCYLLFSTSSVLVAEANQIIMYLPRSCWRLQDLLVGLVLSFEQEGCVWWPAGTPPCRISQSKGARREVAEGEVEEEEPTGYIRFEKFLPVMTEVLLERRYRPSPEDTLLRAFEVLDPSKRGFLTKEELIKYMTEEGEPFSQEEMEEMLSAAIDPESNSIHYKDYIAMMVVDDS